MRRRSLRKKKKVVGAAQATGRDNYDDHNGESEDSDSDMAMTMERTDRRHPQSKGGEYVRTLSRSLSAREHFGHSNRARVQQWERISSSAKSTTLPGVSRVSKVNIPSFLSSPGGSGCSSRYSSTETLKEESTASCGKREANMIFNKSEVGRSNNRPASMSMQSKTYHGNFTMYRSPSFGHGDNFSHNPAGVRPKMIPPVASSPGVGPRQIVMSAEAKDSETKALKRTTVEGGSGDSKNQISTSNPDITSDTMTLLSFLKSDLSELRVRKPSGGDRAGVVEGSAVYRMGSRPHGGTIQSSGRRPSLKDLTATLRRAKSFTYSDKHSTTDRYDMAGGPAKRSSSELDLEVERVSVSDREVESDGGGFGVRAGLRRRDYRFDDDDDEVMPTPLQEKYVQEARQVIQDICQMSTREDDDDVFSVRTDDDLDDECFQVKKMGEVKEKEGVNVQDEARRGEDSPSNNREDRDEHGRERGRENREREGAQLEKLNSRATDYGEKAQMQRRDVEKTLLKCDSEENMFYERSLDELSGHESSLTDEGIVTEPELGPLDCSDRSFVAPASIIFGSQTPRDVTGQPVSVWKQSALQKVQGFKKDLDQITKNSISCNTDLSAASVTPSLPPSACLAKSDCIITDKDSALNVNSINFTGEEITVNNRGLQDSPASLAKGLETPATPSSVRRRRKFSPSGSATGSDSSNGSNSESTVASVGNGESAVYRSLSDPMPQRCCSVAEEGNNTFSSVDSNLLGSLSVKGGGGGVLEVSDVATSSEYKGSAASDLSLCSDIGLRDDCVQDYSGVIRSIVAEPGAMDRLMTDDHSNGKGPKKKSFSDPSRRSDVSLLSQNDPQFKGQPSSSQPIGEMDPPGQIPPSSSEPILSEQREQQWMPQAEPAQTGSHKVKKVRSQSECLPVPDSRDGPADVTDQGEEKDDELGKFNFNLHLAEALSPRMIRRPCRKRPNRLAHFFSHEDPLEPSEYCPEGQKHQNDHNDLTPLPPSSLLPLKSRSKTKPKHIRHASEPSTFIPISPPPQLQPLKEVDCLSPRSPAGAPTPVQSPAEEAPSLQDATQKYSFEQSTTDRQCEGPGPGAPQVSRYGVDASASALEVQNKTSNSGITEPRIQKKDVEDAVPQTTKPRVVSTVGVQFFFCSAPAWSLRFLNSGSIVQLCCL